MNGIEKQIEYWVKGSRQDMRVGDLLLKERKTRHGLFFLHLAMEKLLKALVCKVTQQPAPKIHSLAVLADRAAATLEPEQKQFLGEFNRFNLAGRYPNEESPIPRAPETIELAREFRKVYRCLVKQL